MSLRSSLLNRNSPYKHEASVPLLLVLTKWNILVEALQSTWYWCGEKHKEIFLPDRYHLGSALLSIPSCWSSETRSNQPWLFFMNISSSWYLIASWRHIFISREWSCDCIVLMQNRSSIISILPQLTLWFQAIKTCCRLLRIIALTQLILFLLIRHLKLRLSGYLTNSMLAKSEGVKLKQCTTRDRVWEYHVRWIEPSLVFLFQTSNRSSQHFSFSLSRLTADKRSKLFMLPI